MTVEEEHVWLIHIIISVVQNVPYTMLHTKNN